MLNNDSKMAKPIKSFWESRTLFSKRVLAAGGVLPFIIYYSSDYSCSRAVQGAILERRC